MISLEDPGSYDHRCLHAGMPGDRGRVSSARRKRSRGFEPARSLPRRAKGAVLRQWRRICRPDGGPVSLSQQGPHGLLQASHADRQCPHRVIQWLAARRVPKPALVRNAGRSKTGNRSLETRLQREPASHGPWRHRPFGICFASKELPDHNEKLSRRNITLAPDHLSQALHSPPSLTNDSEHLTGSGQGRARQS